MNEAHSLKSNRKHPYNLALFILFCIQGIVLLIVGIWGEVRQPVELYFNGLIELAGMPWETIWISIGYLLPAIFLMSFRSIDYKYLCYISGFLAALTIGCVLFFKAGIAVISAIMASNLWINANTSN